MPHTPQRVVPVAVDVIASGDGTVRIDCTPSPADIIKGTRHALLVFTLNTTGYRFRTAHAIKLDVSVDDFPYASWTISDTQAALYDRNHTANAFDYTVTVVNTTTGQECSADPVVQNGGGNVGGCD